MNIPDLRGALKIITAVCAIVAALAGGVTGWVTLGWWTPASREYVNGEIHLVSGVVLGLARDQRDRLRRTKDMLVQRRTTTKDPQARMDLDQLVFQAETDVIEVESWIVDLERLRRRAP